MKRFVSLSIVFTIVLCGALARTGLAPAEALQAQFQLAFAASANDLCSGRGVAREGKCFCVAGYDGAHCENKLAGKCENGGISEYARCFCPPGYSGNMCQTVDAGPPNCDQHGILRYGRCFCNPGYRGERCDVAINPVCQNGGVSAYGQCYCPYDWGGALCEKSTANGMSCANGGIVYHIACYCPLGFTGKVCEKKLPKNAYAWRTNESGLPNPVRKAAWVG